MAQTAWVFDTSSRTFHGEHHANVETFITHNGDLDFYTLNEVMYPVDELFGVLEWILDCRRPASVDSAGVAGLLDLLRAKGLWLASVRCGYLFGGVVDKGNLSMAARSGNLATASTLRQVAGLFERTWAEILTNPKGGADLEGGEAGLTPLAMEAVAADRLKPMMQLRLTQLLVERGLGSSLQLQPKQLDHFVTETLNAFFFNDLVAAASRLLKHAMGSFGLVLSSSLDANAEIIIAARGQTMSIACYPALGIVMFGSESSATKVTCSSSLVCELAAARVWGDGWIQGGRPGRECGGGWIVGEALTARRMGHRMHASHMASPCNGRRA